MPSFNRVRQSASFANVTSALALVIALGGTSYAAVQIPKNSVGSKQVKNKSLKAKDFKPGQLPAGARGPRGAAGSAVAYAYVNESGAVVESRSFNLTDANIDSDTLAGVVCFKDLPFTPKSIIATADAFHQDVFAGAWTHPTGGITWGDCQGQAYVTTYDVSSGALANRAFTVWFED